MAYEELFTDLLKAEREEDVAVEPIELKFSVPTFTKNVKVGQPRYRGRISIRRQRNRS